MSYGLQVFNNSNQVLVDSEFEHFHFAGKAQFFSKTRVPDILGGNFTDHSTREGEYISAYQTSGDIFKYILYANAGSASPPPLCFVKPVATGTSAPTCGVFITYREGSNWIIWLLQTRGYSAPTLYCFLPLRHMTPAAANPDTNYSLATYSSQGLRTYDARVRPLKVIATGSLTSPGLARYGSKANGWNPVFWADSPNSSTFSAPSSPPVSDLIFYCPSIAHSCQDHKLSTSGDGFQSKGYNSYFYAWAREDLWWCFYRSTFRFTSNNTIQSWYEIYASGHVWKAVEDQTSLLGVIALVGLAFLTFGASLLVIGVALGGLVAAAAFTNAGVASGTYYPYQNSARNNAQSNSYLISRASYYD